MTEPERNVAASACDHHYETRILGGHPLSVRIFTLCRTSDWADLYEQADALFRWGREEALAGKPARVTLSAYDRPTERESDVGTEFVRQADHPSETALAAFEADLHSSTAPKGDSKDGEHVYLSTGCLHGQHGYCQSMTGQQGRKRPAECKFCQARCVCPCHSEEGAA